MVKVELNKPVWVKVRKILPEDLSLPLEIIFIILKDS